MTTQTINLVKTQLKPLTIGIVAGEISGDALGADFMHQMNNLRDDITWVGVGGSKMQALGLKSIIDMSRLSVMGLVEVISHLSDLFAARDEILQTFFDKKIDIFVGIDAPDFNLRLGKKLKPTGVFCVQYVSPSIWAWREGRIHNIKQSTDLVLCLFPFELDVYQKHHHPAVCVGHPLLKTIDKKLLHTDVLDLRLNLIWENPYLHQFFASFGKGKKDDMSHLIAVMPGSRRSEIASILPNMLESMHKLLLMDNQLCFIIPTINQNFKTMVEQYLQNEPNQLQERVVVCCDENIANFSQQIMAISDLILLASGTATLEAMLLNRPMVVTYTMKPLTYWLAKRLVKIDYVALPNILANKQIVPELIQDEATADNICRTVQQNLTPQKYQQQLHELSQTTQTLRQQSNVNPAVAVINAWFGF
ncbi:lipid-A-disaccharide synthase [Faucicola mancuniensis]|uniref:lipid-A-disaccharide synthase n=1 Tax=Faucicola mancuniensis TaxID=1309795 RepID=UPI0039779824